MGPVATAFIAAARAERSTLPRISSASPMNQATPLAANRFPCTARMPTFAASSWSTLNCRPRTPPAAILEISATLPVPLERVDSQPRAPRSFFQQNDPCPARLPAAGRLRTRCLLGKGSADPQRLTPDAGQNTLAGGIAQDHAVRR